MPMRSMWKGAVSFGLVSIPINLYAATESHNVSFRQVHESDGGRVQYKRFCSIEGTEVPYAEIAKGYETDDGEMVILTDADLADLPLPTQRGIEVVEFVPLEAIDPIYFDRTYYMEPQKAALKPYVLLRDALHKSGQVAIAQVVLRQRETLAVLRVYSDVLVLTTILWPDEVRTPEFPFLHEDNPQVRPQELTMAGSLIDSMSDRVYDPSKYVDRYQEALNELIDARISGRQITKPGAPPEENTADLLSALRASLAGAKKSAAGADSDINESDTKESDTKESAAEKSAKGTTKPKTTKPTAKSEPKERAPRRSSKSA